ncbi:GRAM domain-containing protein 1B-like protein [Leptotrombidium deliense]|uniref:GRAM domain-containing protein 1B-like protein n=1 Tax=Leptotrombidium deliense TaxID=299467 RepID=A0A443SBG7_9ACAR|nr:GRAM domain-containing protein 1B-like protein [Leptotrombidium deliense]
MPDGKDGDEMGCNSEEHERFELLNGNYEVSANAESGTELSSSSDDQDLIVEPPKRNDELCFPSCLCENHKGFQLIDDTFELSASAAFELAFFDSPFYRKLLEERKTENLTLTPWNEEDCNGSIVKSRQLTYQVFLNHALAKFVSTTETQFIVHESPNNETYTIRSEASSTGAPYSNTFVVVSHWCISRAADADQCRIRVHAEIMHKKSSWSVGLMKPFIEKSAIQGMTDYCRHFVKTLHKWSENKANYETVSSSDKSSNDLHVPNLNPSPVVRRKTPSFEEQVNETIVNTAGSVSTIRPNAVPEVQIYDKIGDTFLLRIVLVVLLILLVCNVLLYIRLLQLESAAKDFDSIVLKASESSSDFPPEVLIAKLRNTILSAINLIRNMENNLLDLEDKFTNDF